MATGCLKDGEFFISKLQNFSAQHLAYLFHEYQYLVSSSLLMQTSTIMCYLYQKCSVSRINIFQQAGLFSLNRTPSKQFITSQTSLLLLKCFYLFAPIFLLTLQCITLGTFLKMFDRIVCYAIRNTIGSRSR